RRDRIVVIARYDLRAHDPRRVVPVELPPGRGQQLEHGPASDERNRRNWAVNASVTHVADESGTRRIGAYTDNGIRLQALHNRYLAIVALVEGRAPPIRGFAGNLQARSEE